MRRSITFRQYRTLDLLFWTFLLCLCEALIVLGARLWFPYEAYTLSVIPAVSGIVMVRWGVFAALPAFAGSVVFCMLSGALPIQYLIYCLGSMTLLALLPIIRNTGWKRLRSDVLLCMLYGLAVGILMQAGRFLIALALGTAPSAATAFFTTDALSVFFCVLLMWIARRLDGILEDQQHYLARIRKETEQERGMNP